MATEQKRNVQLWPRMMRVKSLTTQLETVKRPSCRVKGRIGADDNQQETRVARTAKCRQKQKAGYNQHTSPNFRHTAPILPILAKMENNGKSKYTLKNYAKLLKYLSKNTNMNNPEQVKQFIAKIEGSNGYKKNLCLAYNKYSQYYNIKWEMPFYIPNPRQIRIPTTENLNILIAYAGQTLSLKLMISKETGMRPVELMNLKVKDVDLEQKTVYPTTAKHGAPTII